jgi:hypothetical protein
MREILYRGKRVDNGGWVFGAYLPPVGGYPPNVSTAHEIRVVGKSGLFKWHEVIPKTVGEYTGLEAVDSNRYTAAGEKDLRIFEGDIVKVDEIYQKKLDTPLIFYYITYECGSYRLRFYPEYHGENEKDISWFSLPLYHFERNMKIIGNIHDSPELLGRDKEE